MIVPDVHEFDPTPYLASGVQPEIPAPRPQDLETYVRRQQDGGFAWHKASGSHVRVPVVAYAAPRRLGMLPTVGFQLALNCLDELQVLTGRTPRRITLVVGSQCHDLAPDRDAYRVYLGCAFHL